MTHTPLPWSVTGKADEIMDVVVSGPKSQGICEMTGHVSQDRDADAAFIVRAVNSHSALLEALELLLKKADLFSVVYLAEFEDARAAINQATT
jgi:hypothetical protein